jgi:uncharacterized protein (DUF3820 family)
MRWSSRRLPIARGCSRNRPVDPQDLQRLVTTRMPFGKYEGRLLADLPGAYLAWFARKGFPAGQLGQLLALALEIDHNGLSSLLDPLRKRSPPSHSD